MALLTNDRSGGGYLAALSAEWGVRSGLVGAYRLRRALAGDAVAADLSWAAWVRLLHSRLWLSRCRQK
ncbi:MAG: hypothetical protein IPM39_26655 [Chloroflexi bacterium]|nr:hypothetical protein [Chloroflexota bacterium]